jgi:pSer/pThr/pTyr-binding forkhead associated (FHA) protein
MLAQLIPQTGGQPITIDRDLTLVGRNRHICDLHLNHISISKIHCLIVKTDGLLFIRDLGSSNGTRVNGQRISRGALLPGDQLSFANLKYKVYLGPDRAPRTDQTEVIPIAQKLVKKKRPGGVSGSHSVRKSSAKPKPVLAESDSDVRIIRDISDDGIEIVD